MTASFENTQRQLADYLREPETRKPVEGVESRRLKIYEDLIFKNIEGFLSGGFPILKSLYSEDEWLQLVRLFIVNHQAHTPYFLKISEEFLQFLQEQFEPRDCDPGFMLELAHYEWVELALDVSTESFPDGRETDNLLEEKPTVSPLAWTLSYQYPVHRLGPEFRPDTPPELPTFLIVYRNRDDRVSFMESNAMTVRLLSLLGEGDCTGREALLQLAEESQHPDPQTLVQMGAELLANLKSSQIII